MDYVLRGIEQGFRIGFHGNRDNLRARMKNMVSAKEHPVVVAKYLEDEVSRKRVALITTLMTSSQWESQVLGVCR